MGSKSIARGAVLGVAIGTLSLSTQPGVAAERAVASAPKPASAPVVHPALWPSPKWPLAPNVADEARIADLLKRMTLEEKVGQVVQADIDSITPDEVRRYHIGSVLNGGNSGPNKDDFAPAPKWLELADALYAASVDTSAGGQGIPILWGIDAVHGHSNIIGATLFPQNIGLGAMRDPDLIERIGAATAVEIRTTGQEWTFAPTITVPQDYRWGRAYEGYSSNPDLVASYAGRMIVGLQGKPDGSRMLAGPHVLASTKHFIADGGTFEGRDQGDARISETELRDVHGKPYIPALEAGVGTVMTSFSSWQGQKIGGSKGLVTDLLKGRMHFGGFVVTDWNAHGQIAGCTNDSCPQAINAGVDMYMAPDSWRALYGSLLTQVKDGTVPMPRLDDAVARILRVKLRLGLFEAGKPSSRPLAGDWSLLGAPAHRAVAREAVGKSLVLLKNSGVLPLKPNANILVAGDGADDVARQSGGWTITWQGTGLTKAMFPGATTLWGGIHAAVKAAGGHAELRPDGAYTTKPDAAIVVFGETPYAEFQGDIKSLQLRPELRAPLATMRKLKAAGIPVVAVMLTGRPLFVNPELNAADAFVVAWLPGSEGGGVADRLFAAPGVAAPFTGALPTAWPLTAKPGGPALYRFGYGLSGRERGTLWRKLSEDPGVADAGTDGVFLAAGVATPGWSLQVGDGAASVTRITTVPAQALGGRIKVTAVDYGVQEGARHFALAGGAAQTIALRSERPVDLSRESNGDVMMLATLRLDAPQGSDLTLGMACDGAGCAGSRALAPGSLPVGAWRTIGIPIKCFAATVAMQRVTAPFELRTRQPLAISIARVSLGMVADDVLKCQP
ncbi:glycoside hydrolase family 3 N-terminal domain-containing protein [Sphingomonas sp. RB3P16]|uniref:glycoside hydrolase family 3 protein n=1 Tax=Parasphingomonas frigoris TaxID=3096163 RepID=UPI002FC742F4